MGDPSEPSPFFHALEEQGIRDFWEAYDADFEVIQEEILSVARSVSGLRLVIERMSPDQLESDSRLSRSLMNRALLHGEWDAWLAYMREQGAIYARVGVSFPEWFVLVSAFKRRIIPRLTDRHLSEPLRLRAALLAMTGYVDLAMGTIGEAYLRTKESIIAQQREAIQELSTPVLTLRERMLLAPLVGLIDTQRARHLTEQLLRSIRKERARVVVVDITGVPAVDSKVANHLLQTIAAARLMGAKAIVTGLSAEVAQALVALGVDLERLHTVGDLQGGLEEAERLLGGVPLAGV